MSPDESKPQYRDSKEIVLELHNVGYALENELLHEAAGALHRAEVDRKGYRDNLIVIDSKVRRLEQINEHSASTTEFREGVLYAAKEIRRGLARWAENDA